MDKSPAVNEPERATDFRNIAGSVGILGLNPEKDAIRQTMSTGVRIWYYRDEEIRRVSMTNSRPCKWTTDFVCDPEKAKETLNACESENITVMDSSVFNWLSETLSDVQRAHDGLLWGITLQFDYQIENGNNPSSISLKSVAGIGDKLGKQIARSLDETYSNTNPVTINKREYVTIVSNGTEETRKEEITTLLSENSISIDCSKIDREGDFFAQLVARLNERIDLTNIISGSRLTGSQVREALLDTNESVIVYEFGDVDDRIQKVISDFFKRLSNKDNFNETVGYTVENENVVFTKYQN